MGAEMTALIFGSSACSDWAFLRHYCPAPDLVIAADGGVHCARSAGYEPNLLVGDWDSGGQPEEEIPSVTLPPEKDLTDLQAAAEIALQRGFQKIVFTACTGGRLDQTMANLALLEWVHNRGGDALLLDEGNEARFWDGRTLEISQDERLTFLSLLPLDETISGVTLKGVKYPLENATLHRGDTLTISNEIVARQAVLWAKNGRMLIIQSPKRHFI